MGSVQTEILGNRSGNFWRVAAVMAEV